MSNRADEIRRRHQERKKNRPTSDYRKTQSGTGKGLETPPLWQREPIHSSGKSVKKEQPLIKKEVFLFRLLAAAVLFLGVGVLYKSTSPSFDPARAFVQNTFKHDFQFAQVSSWYEKKFGEPLALIPNQKSKQMKVNQKKNLGYVIPVNGTVTETFKDTGEKGILLETGSNAAVNAVKQGFVTFVGKKKGFGKTVVIQLQDGGEAWYGELAKVDVGLYDYVQRGKKVGTVTTSGNGKSGQFFFALKKNNAFVNPLKVIPFG